MTRNRIFFALLLLALPLSDSASTGVQKRLSQDDDDQPGNRVQWQGWDFTWSIRPREGLALSNVKFKGKSVLKFAALVEIFVPYNKGDPRPEDIGGDGIGHKLVELFPGKDCIPGTSACQAFDLTGKEKGKRYVMMHEEATGLSYIGPGGRAYGKMLTLWCTYNLGGYLYISRWRFLDDGCLMPDIGLTGPLQHTDTGDASTPYGSVVGKRGDGKVFAPSHVHNMYFCLDFDIDGTKNTVEEFNYVQDKPGSLSGKHSWTPIRRETSRSANAKTFRSWRVVNNASKNALGLPRSYELIPGGNGIFRGGSDEAIAQAELWVTRYHADEYPAEKQSLANALPKYLNGESVENQDVVIWYAIHSHHIPRTEDWPGMPVMWVGFTLRPRDFLDRSPVTPK
jgi:primary-amine oxidase